MLSLSDKMVDVACCVFCCIFYQVVNKLQTMSLDSGSDSCQIVQKQSDLECKYIKFINYIYGPK